MKSRFLFLIFLTILANRFSFSETIKSIEIIGSDNMSRGTVLSYLPVEVNDEFNANVSNAILTSLYKTDFYKNIEIDFQDQTLKIALEENPTVKFIEFQNYDEDNEVLSEELVTEIVKNTRLGVGNIFSKSTLSDLVKQVTNLYKSKGFYSASIEEKIELDPQNRIGIELIINEGERALINSVKIEGASHFSEADLKDALKIGEPDFFIINYFTKRNQFSEISLEAGIENIIKKYVDEGFLEFEVLEKKTIFNNDKTEIEILIRISEGERFVVDSIAFGGDVDENIINDLQKLVKTKPGDFVKRSVILGDLKSLNSYFTNKGYAFSKINTSFIPTDKKNKIKVVATVDKSKRYYLNRIEISGNTRTQDSVIRRELKLNEGQVYSKADLDNSITRIKRIGYFSKVDSSLKKTKEEDKVDLLIEVVETKTGEFAVGLSHSNTSGASINASIEQRNVLGTGNTLNAKFRNSKAVEEVELFFSDPFFNQNKHSISYGFYTKSLDAANLDISSYLIDENGLSFGYGIPLTETSKIRALTKLSDLKITCGSLFGSSSYEPIQCASNDSLMSTLQLSYSDNTLNDFYMPTEGLKTNIDLTLTTPLSEFNFISMGLSHKTYTPLTDDLVFNFQSKVNLATGYGGKELPFFKRYYAGGSSSVRGFDFNSLGVKYANGAPKGGESSLLTSFSLIAPASKVGLDQENIRLQAFFDLGSVNEKISDFQLDELRGSTGLALSWLTPIGPIGFHAAKPILKKSTDSIETFSFELGTTF